jgi:signal transduction histidine kinase
MASYAGNVSNELPPTPTLAALRRARARRQAVLRRMLFIGFAVLVFVTVGVARSTPRPGLHGTSLGVSIALAGLAVGTMWLGLTCVAGDVPQRRIPGAVKAAFFGLLFLSSAALVWLQPNGPGLIGLLVASGSVVRGLGWMPRLGGRRRYAAFAVGATVLFLVVTDAAGRHGGKTAFSGVLGAFGLAAVYATVMLARRLAEGNDQTEQLLVELEQTRGAELRAAALAERQRLAREMHDVLAHSLSGLTLQLEGARLLATQDPADPRLADTIERAHHLAKSGLDEARRAIGVLRDEELPGPERLADLVAEFERDSGISCRFAVEGAERELGSQTRLAMYRVTQEALTNVRKHAHPERVEVRLGYVSRGARLVIEDFDGARPERWSGPAGGGYGLNGMRERAELIGGRLTAAATQRGFRVELEVPA